MPLKAFDYDHSYQRLPEHFYARVQPDPVPAPYWVHFNPMAAELIDLKRDETNQQSLLNILAGNQIDEHHDPIAMLYAGHQFGHWVPQLGDGRAIQIGEVINNGGQRWALQLKGAGITPFSRDGDGRAVLRSSIREYLCSEAMHGLGIPTTRALSIVGSDLEVYRENIETAAVVMRMSPSFVRFGHFEVFASRGQTEDIRTLADYVIRHHYPEFFERENPYAALFNQVVLSTADLMAHWQTVGFMHGVMNTDNMSILGLTIDYGPFGFMDSYKPGHICNHSDYQGRYAYNQQPNIGLWNLVKLAEALTSLIDIETLQKILEGYEQRFMIGYTQQMREKLGLFDEPQAVDADLINELLAMMQQSGADYTNTFRALSYYRSDDETTATRFRDEFFDRNAIDHWLLKYRERLLQSDINCDERLQKMQKLNPKFVLRNYLAQQAIEKAQQKDYSEIDTLLMLLQKPFDEHEGYEAYTSPPPEWATGLEVSCSS